MTGPLLALPPVAPPKPATAPAARKVIPAPPPNPGLAVLTYLRLHWLLILFCGSLIGAPAAYAAWTLLPGKYVSYSLIQIESNPLAVAGGDAGRSGVTAFDTYVKTQKALIRSAFVLNAALDDKSYGISKLPTLADQRDPLKYLEEKLEVEATGSELLRISFEGERPDDVRKIVAAVTAAYLQECVATDIERRKKIKGKFDGFKVELEKMLAQRLGPTGTPDPSVVRAGGVLPAGKAADSPVVRQMLFGDARDTLGTLKRELKAIPQRMAKLTAEGNDYAGRIEAIKKAEPTAEEVAFLDTDEQVVTMRRYAAGLRERYLSRLRTHPDPNSPHVQDLKAQAEQAAADADKLRAEKLANLVRQAKRGEVAGLSRELGRIRQEFDLLQRREKELPPLIEVAMKELTDNLSPEVVQASATKAPPVDTQLTDLTTLHGLYAAVALQTERLSFEIKTDRVYERQQATNPTLKDNKKQLMATVAAGLLGFALVGAGVVATESRAKRVCSLADMTAVSPAPVVGVVPAIPTGDDPVGRAAAAEAMDRLRSRVTQQYLARGATTLAVTSPLADEGKAITAYGLANSLALAGFKTLLLDFDLRTPTLHRHAGVPNEDGLCELLLGQTDPRRAMIVLANGLHFIPAGAFSEEARAAAVGSRLAALVAALREPFDCVLLHGHALLAAAEAVEVVRRADAVLLCGSYRESRLPLLKRAVDRLAVMEVPHVGIVYLGATTHEALC